MKIATKFINSISVVFLGYVFTIVVTYLVGAQNEQRLNYAARVIFPAVLESKKAQTAFDQQYKAYEEAVLQGENKFIETGNALGGDVQTALSQINLSNQLPAETDEQITTLRQRLSSWNLSAKETYSVVINSQQESDPSVVLQCQVLSDEYTAFTEELEQLVYNLTQSLTDEHETIIKGNKTQIVLNTAFFFIVTLICLISVSIMLKKVVGPIQSLARSALQIKDGDLKHRSTVKSSDEIGELAHSFNSMTDKLSQAVTTLQLEILERKKAQEELAAHRDHLEEMVKQRTAELKNAQKELIDRAHKAGMADIATGVLHNIGNLLNSVKSSTQLILEITNKSETNNLKKANQLLKSNMDNLEEFICRNPKGRKLMEYYLKLEEGFVEENSQYLLHVTRLNQKIGAIADVVMAQQSYAGNDKLCEILSLEEIVNDALIIQSVSYERHGLKVIKEFNCPQPVIGQKIKIVHILVNLFKNAKEAMESCPREKKMLTITADCCPPYAYVRVTDTGDGINESELTKIFTQGYTTKKGGHGFGLHSCANYMTEMGGEIRAESEGPGKGATFILKFKLAHPVTKES